MDYQDLIEPFTSLFDPRQFERTRRNHGLEHATITLITNKMPQLRLAGRSTSKGFYVYGDVDTNLLTQTANEAIQRLKSGDAYLAVHPQCGTNLVAGGLIAGLATFLSVASDQRRGRTQPSLSKMALLSTVALLASRPAGHYLQEHVTTSPDIRDMRIASVDRHESRGMVTHFVRTEG